MNDYIKKLGVDTSKFAFTDVWGLDEDMLAYVPKPVAAVILLFPVTDKYDMARKQEEERIRTSGQKVSPKVYFIKQTIANAYDGPLKRILERGANKTPEERAKLLEEDEDLAAVHAASSHEGQTAAPRLEDDVNLHFVAFAKVDGDIYEFDGNKIAPINHGPAGDVMTGSAKVIKQFMDREPDEVQFTVIALVPKQENEMA
ncbi:Ubiquitin carboxyl-terminal hydrolase isozyme L3 [Irineochytrium annulatum]|nr:Ubiquitin carboxyl-terminal hydrolase isozyme L3 [Irineochytrium annulatum]